MQQDLARRPEQDESREEILRHAAEEQAAAAAAEAPKPEAAAGAADRTSGCADRPRAEKVREDDLICTAELYAGPRGFRQRGGTAAYDMADHSAARCSSPSSKDIHQQENRQGVRQDRALTSPTCTSSVRVTKFLAADKAGDAGGSNIKNGTLPAPMQGKVVL